MSLYDDPSFGCLGTTVEELKVLPEVHVTSLRWAGLNCITTLRSQRRQVWPLFPVEDKLPKRSPATEIRYSKCSPHGKTIGNGFLRERGGIGDQHAPVCWEEDPRGPS